MSTSNSPADYLPEDILRAREEADTDAMATPVLRAIRAIPPAHMTPEVARSIIETLAAAMMRSAYALSMDEAVNALCDVEYALWDATK